MDKEILQQTTKLLMSSPKGILAADESMKTIEKRFEALGVENSEENRRNYREMLFSTPGVGDFLSGVILFDETIRQKNSSDVLFPKYLSDMGVVVGIKVDKGLVDFPGVEGEKYSEGLDGIKDRLSEYFDLGARFSKWRVVSRVAPGIFPDKVVGANSFILSMYALNSQQANIVPIVEPETLMDGTHTIAQCRDTTYRVLKRLFESLSYYDVSMENLILKVNMVVSGKESGESASSVEVAENTTAVLKEVVPSDIGGVVFLSGGQKPLEAISNLNEISLRLKDVSWPATFSFSRALQEPAMEAWSKGFNKDESQAVFLKYLSFASMAVKGEYKSE